MRAAVGEDDRYGKNGGCLALGRDVEQPEEEGRAAGGHQGLLCGIAPAQLRDGEGDLPERALLPAGGLAAQRVLQRLGHLRDERPAGPAGVGRACSMARAGVRRGGVGVMGGPGPGSNASCLVRLENECRRLR